MAANETLLAGKLLPKRGRLPLILPIVLYSGVRRWTAPHSMAGLLDPSPQALQPYALQLRYLLIDQGELVQSGALPNIVVPTVDNLLEIKAMLIEHSRSWTHQWKAEGLKEGRQEGRQEGVSAVLQKQLQRKFGALPPATQQQIKNATAEQLEVGSLNMVDASTLDEVFAE